MRVRNLSILVSLFCCFQTAIFSAAPKRLLVVFKSSEGQTSSDNPVLKYLEPALAKDYRLDYYDIEQGLPTEEELQDYQAIISWHKTAIIKNPKAYLNWLTKNIYAGRKVIILDNLGAYSVDGNTWLTNEALNRFFLPFGLEFGGLWTDNPTLLRVVHFDDNFLGAEIPIELMEFNNYFKFASVYAGNKSYLVLDRSDITDGESHCVVRTPFGGMALQGYVTGFRDGQERFFLKVEAFVRDCLEAPLALEYLPHNLILALVKRSENPTLAESYINLYATKSFHILGYKPEFRFVEDGLPGLEEMEAYQAIITWFTTPEMAGAQAYLSWLSQQLIAGRKFIFLGNLGAFKEAEMATNNPDNASPSVATINDFLNRFGLEYQSDWVGDPNNLNIISMVSRVVEKDIPLAQADLKHYYTWRSVNPDNKVFLSVARRDVPDSESAFVVKTPHGGMAFEGYIFKWDDMEKKLYHRLNIFEFLKECLPSQSNIALERKSTEKKEPKIDEKKEPKTEEKKRRRRRHGRQ